MIGVNRRVPIMATLAAAGVILAGGRDAKADMSKLTVSKGGIVVVAGSGTGTDPAYTYQFDLTLTGKAQRLFLFEAADSGHL